MTFDLIKSACKARIFIMHGCPINEIVNKKQFVAYETLKPEVSKYIASSETFFMFDLGFVVYALTTIEFH
jgi:hypothetical protein